MNEAQSFLGTLERLIHERRKMTSPLYQVILEGNATLDLLKNFIIHRYPIKNFWTRNILGVASRIEDYELRRELVENIYEEETGALTRSARHLETFVQVGVCLGLDREAIVNGPVLPETQAVIDHNVSVCNGTRHFTEGVASVLLLMEGQPPILNRKRDDMLTIMRDTYRLPAIGCEYFVHHAASAPGSAGVSALEEDHAAAAKKILQKYCDTPERRASAVAQLTRALELRHAHFAMIHERFYRPEAKPFRFAA